MRTHKHRYTILSSYHILEQSKSFRARHTSYDKVQVYIHFICYLFHCASVLISPSYFRTSMFNVASILRLHDPTVCLRLLLSSVFFTGLSVLSSRLLGTLHSTPFTPRLRPELSGAHSCSSRSVQGRSRSDRLSIGYFLLGDCPSRAYHQSNTRYCGGRFLIAGFPQ